MNKTTHSVARIGAQARAARSHDACHGVTKLGLEKIRTAETTTRGLSGAHVTALAHSIAEVGLLHPIVVDETGRLLAGAHRLAALCHLKECSPECYARICSNDEIPVRTLSLNAGDDAQRQALLVELSENEKRKNYSKEEVLRLADRLKSVGYRSGSGHMHPGQKHLGPTLAVVLGRSLRTVRRILNEGKTPVRKAAEAPHRKVIVDIERAVKAYLCAIGTEPMADERPDLTRYVREIGEKVASFKTKPASIDFT